MYYNKYDYIHINKNVYINLKYFYFFKYSRVIKTYFNMIYIWFLMLFFIDTKLHK